MPVKKEKREKIGNFTKSSSKYDLSDLSSSHYINYPTASQWYQGENDSQTHRLLNHHGGKL